MRSWPGPGPEEQRGQRETRGSDLLGAGHTPSVDGLSLPARASRVQPGLTQHLNCSPWSHRLGCWTLQDGHDPLSQLWPRHLP